MKKITLFLIIFISLYADEYTPQSVNIQKLANGVIALMGYSLTPDVTTGSISLSNDPTGNPHLNMVSIGGGATMDKEFPIYLEGTAGASRYDPVFVLSDGQDERTIPAKWNSVSGTVGIGWGFYLTDTLIFRPIFNGSTGYVASDASIASDIIEHKTDTTMDFLQGGKLNVYGLGGTLMLDIEDYTPDREIDVELRYTDINLQSYNSSSAVEGSADATTLALWARWRAPTGVCLMNKPVRYVLEGARTQFYGDLDGTLGFDALNSIGAGIELDSSAYNIIVTRTRFVIRHMFGENVSGYSLGIAMSF